MEAGRGQVAEGSSIGAGGLQSPLARSGPTRCTRSASVFGAEVKLFVLHEEEAVAAVAAGAAEPGGAGFDIEVSVTINVKRTKRLPPGAAPPPPAGLKEAEKLPAVIFTPATKAPAGQHDENISFAEAEKIVGAELAAKVRAISIQLYSEAAAYAQTKGIIIADTKFEFGLDVAGKLYLIDEILTPDSSRFWPADKYQPGRDQESFDKQFVRNYLEEIKFDKSGPGVKLPDDVVKKTGEKYIECYERLTDKKFGFQN